MNELKSNISPHILETPQNKPLFIPLGFEVDWVGLHPLSFILYRVLTPIGCTNINLVDEHKHRLNQQNN